MQHYGERKPPSEPTTYYRVGNPDQRFVGTIYSSWETIVEVAVDSGVFVPVELCEHGNTRRHIIEGTVRLVGIAEPTVDFEWCSGEG